MSFFLVGSLLAGCGSGPAQSGGSDPNLPADIRAIKDRGALSAGVKVDVPKFGYKDPKTNVIEGFEIDLVKALAKEIFGDPDKIKLQAVTAKTRGPLLDSGDVDMVVATFTITEDRKKRL